MSVSISSCDHDTTLFAVNVGRHAARWIQLHPHMDESRQRTTATTATATHDQTITANDVTAPVSDPRNTPDLHGGRVLRRRRPFTSRCGYTEASAEDGCDSELDVDVTYTHDNLAFNEVVGDYSLVIDTISGPEEGVIGIDHGAHVHRDRE